MYRRKIGYTGEPKVVYFSMAISKFNMVTVGFLGKLLLVHPIYRMITRQHFVWVQRNSVFLIYRISRHDRRLKADIVERGDVGS